MVADFVVSGKVGFLALRETERLLIPEFATLGAGLARLDDDYVGFGTGGFFNGSSFCSSPGTCDF